MGKHVVKEQMGGCSFYLVEEQDEVQGKCQEESQEAQVVKVSGEVVLQGSDSKFSLMTSDE